MSDEKPVGRRCTVFVRLPWRMRLWVALGSPVRISWQHERLLVAESFSPWKRWQLHRFSSAMAKTTRPATDKEILRLRKRKP